MRIHIHVGDMIHSPNNHIIPLLYTQREDKYRQKKNCKVENMDLMFCKCFMRKYTYLTHLLNYKGTHRATEIYLHKNATLVSVFN